MTIIEETDSENKSELKLWENTDGKIWIEVGYGDDDPMMNQGISITTEDAKGLISELTRLLKNIEPQITEPKTTEIQPKTNGQLTLSKVDWNKAVK